MNDQPATPDEPTQPDEPRQPVEPVTLAEPPAPLPEPEPPAPAADPESAPASPPASAVAPEAVRRQNRLAAYATVVLVVVLAFGAGFATGRGTAPAAPPSLAPIATAPTAASPGASDGAASPGATPAASGLAALPSDGPRLGRADATVVIDYWADYQCPFCARFAQQVIPQLESRIADGRVALVHRDYAFIGNESLDAAIAVRCAGRQDRYWPMHAAVYAAQQGENQGAFARPRLAQIAASVGLEADAFATCMDDHAVLVEVLDDTAAGVRAGIESTPTVDVNGHRLLGVPDVAAFLDTVDAAAAGASPGILPTPSPIVGDWSGVRTAGREAGDPGAPVTVELWMDYQSPASKAVVTDLEPELRARTGAGAIRMVQRDLATLGEESVVAAAAVRCVAAQGAEAWFLHDILGVSAQGAGAGIYTAENLLRVASRLGLDVKAFDACLADGAVADAVRAETAQGTAAGLAAGPAVVVLRGDEAVKRFTGDLEVNAILSAVDAAG